MRATRSRLNDLLTFRNVVLLGLVLCLAITAFGYIGGKYANFMIFRLSTLDFWNGISPYTENWFRHGYDVYIYSPIFSVLFAPFAYLPEPAGLFTWNLLNYLLVVLAIEKFPSVTNRQKALTLLYIMPILAPSLMSCQYNLSVAALFILALSLMERDKPILAIILMLISGMTKVYGLAELSILIFYPRVWRNLGFTLFFAAIFAVLPIIVWRGDYIQLVGEWFSALGAHKGSRTWQTIFDVSIIEWGSMRAVIVPYIQVGVFALLSIMVLVKSKLWTQFNFRLGVVALIMGWCVLFSNSSESHTYIISILGFLLWYHVTQTQRRDRVIPILYWAVFVIMALVPLDVICPTSVMEFLYQTLDLNKWLMFVLWIYMIVCIFSSKSYQLSVKE